jgi:hypothetical protein
MIRIFAFTLLLIFVSVEAFSQINECGTPDISENEYMALPWYGDEDDAFLDNFYDSLQVAMGGSPLPKMEGAIAVFGQGNAVLNLKNAAWLTEMEILYWGDIDVQGFEILSRLREHFTHIKSVLMDKVTFETFFENDKGTPSNVSTKLNLTDIEQELYNILKTNNWRLEQEKIPFGYVNRFFENEIN